MALVMLAMLACTEEIELLPCAADQDCPGIMRCDAGRCFHRVPPWTVPPCSSPVAGTRCCDLEDPVLPTEGRCRTTLMDGADALSAPARGPDGTLVVTLRTGTSLEVAGFGPDGTERWREEAGLVAMGSAAPVPRVAGDGRVWVAQGERVWTRDAGGGIQELDPGGLVDGDLAACSGGLAVALVRGPGGRGPRRLPRDGEGWGLARPLDVPFALPPAISLPDGIVAVAYADGAVTILGLEDGEARGEHTSAHTATGVTGLAADGEGALWISSADGVLERLSVTGPPTAGYVKIVLPDLQHTPPVIPAGGRVICALGDGQVVQGDDLHAPAPALLAELVTRAPGTLALLEGEGFLLLGGCPEGRCLAFAYDDSASFFGAAFESIGEHRHPGLPPDAAVGLPGPEGVAALSAGGRLDGLVVAGPARNAPWPGPDGGPGNGRCMEGTP